MTCDHCSGEFRGTIYEDPDGDRYCSLECRRDHLLYGIMNALSDIAQAVRR